MVCFLEEFTTVAEEGLRGALLPLSYVSLYGGGKGEYMKHFQPIYFKGKIINVLSLLLAG